MPVTRWGERPSRSRNATLNSVVLEYVAAGEDNAATVISYALSATSVAYPHLGGMLWRQDVALDHVGHKLYHVTVPYGTRNVSELAIAFDTTGGTVHVSTSLETVASYPTSPTPPDFDQMIGVNGDDVEGTDVVIPSLKMTVTKRHEQGELDIAAIKNLARNTGVVNSDTFLTFDAGEVLFLGASGQDGSSSPAEITYHFAMSQNVTGRSIGSAIANVAKKGHEYIWVRYKEATSNGRPVKQPQFAYVERIYETTSLVTLLGFGS